MVTATLLKSGPLKRKVVEKNVWHEQLASLYAIQSQTYHGHEFERVPLDVANFGLVEFLTEAEHQSFCVIVHGQKKMI